MDDFSIAMIGSVIVLGLGIFGSVTPRGVEKLVKIRAEGTTGMAEIRATYGGLFLGLGIGLLYFREPNLYIVAALTAFGAAIMRSVSVVVDKSREKENIGAIAFEILLGVLFLFH